MTKALWAPGLVRTLIWGGRGGIWRFRALVSGVGRALGSYMLRRGKP